MYNLQDSETTAWSTVIQLTTS